MRGSGIALVGGTLRRLLRQVVGEPFSEGREALASLPPSLRVLAYPVLGLIAGVLSVIAVSGPLRRELPLTTTFLGLSFPLGSAHVIAFALIIALSLLTCAVLHMPGAIRWAGWAVVSVVLFLGGSAVTFYEPQLLFVPVLTVLGLTGLLLLTRNRPFRIWEFAVAAALVGGDWTFLWLMYGFFVPSGPTAVVTSLSPFLFSFIAPVACLAGVALAEITVAVGSGAVDALTRQRPELTWRPVLGVVAVAVLGLLVWQHPRPGEIAWSGLLLAAVVGAWLLVGRADDGQLSRRPGTPPNRCGTSSACSAGWSWWP